jgi:hypothetical protein
MCRQELGDCRHRTFACEAHRSAQQQNACVLHFPPMIPRGLATAKTRQFQSAWRACRVTEHSFAPFFSKRISGAPGGARHKACGLLLSLSTISLQLARQCRGSKCHPTRRGMLSGMSLVNVMVISCWQVERCRSCASIPPPGHNDRKSEPPHQLQTEHECSAWEADVRALVPACSLH